MIELQFSPDGRDSPGNEPFPHETRQRIDAVLGGDADG